MTNESATLHKDHTAVPPLPFSPQQLKGLATLCYRSKVADLSYAGEGPMGPELLVQFLPEGRQAWGAEHPELAISIESILDQTIRLLDTDRLQHTAEVLNQSMKLPDSTPIYRHGN